MAGKKKRHVVIYKSYNFVDKDPAIDVVRTMVQLSNKTYRHINDAGGPVPATLYNWFDGKTRRPQFCTLIAAARAVGGDIRFVNRQGELIRLPHNRK
jgi:hypothetical protein